MIFCFFSLNQPCNRPRIYNLAPFVFQLKKGWLLLSQAQITISLPCWFFPLRVMVRMMVRIMLMLMVRMMVIPTYKNTYQPITTNTNQCQKNQDIRKLLIGGSNISHDNKCKIKNRERIYEYSYLNKLNCLACFLSCSVKFNLDKQVGKHVQTNKNEIIRYL